MKRQVLFICGCPRSGTTALWSLLASHNQVAIGVERYVKRVLVNYSLTPEEFKKDRFFNLVDGDTHWKSLTEGKSERTRNFSELIHRFDQCKVVGDKMPKLYKFYQEILATFPNCKILFIYRNPFDVVQSYKRRMLDSNDRWENTIQDGIEDWNESLEVTNNRSDDDRIILVNYEKLFYGDDSVQGLFDHIGLKVDEKVKTKLQNLRKIAAKKDQTRDIILTSLDKLNIASQADTNTYAQLVESNRNVFY